MRMGESLGAEHPLGLAIRRRAGEIAGVMVNPVQSFHPNAPPPSDAILLTSGVRRTEDPSARYAEWLRRLRAVCDECDVPSSSTRCTRAFDSLPVAPRNTS